MGPAKARCGRSFGSQWVVLTGSPVALAESIVMGMSRSAADIDQEVKSGALAYSLTKPYNYLLFHYAKYMGDSMMRFFTSLLVAGAVAWITVGPPVFITAPASC